MKTATIQVLQSEKKALQSEKKFVVTEFDEDCIGNPAAANSMITYKDYSERKKFIKYGLLKKIWKPYSIE